MKRIIDLTHTIEPDMPVYPGTAPPVFFSGTSIERDGFLEKQITFFSHTGTHMDAPAHIIAGGKTLDQLPIETFTGSACIIDVRNMPGGTIELDYLLSHRDRIERSNFVLLYSDWSKFWGSPAYFRDFPVLSPQAAQWLCTMELKGVGLDMISVDSVGSTDFKIHNILLGSEVVIIENLTRLESLPHTDVFNFSCFPLKLVSADGAPVRAVAEIGSV